VRLVAPVPLVRTLTRLSDEAETLSARRSPRRGRVEDIFERLVSIPSLRSGPCFELELILTHQTSFASIDRARHSDGTARSSPAAGSSRSNSAYASSVPTTRPACSRPAYPSSSTPPN
jgi:hypothetical protein